LLFREQSGIELQSERAIGSTDMGLGRGPTRPNAPRTLGGTAIVVRQQQLRSDVFLKRVMFGKGDTGGVAEFLRQYKDLYQAFMPEEKEFRTLGTNEIRTVSRADLMGRFDFVVDFGPEINNPQLRLQNATLRYQTALTNPLIIQNPQAFWQITIDFLEATGMHNAGRTLPPPTGVEDRPIMPQEEELVMLSKGLYIDPVPSDDHGQHLAVIAQVLQDPMKLAQYFNANTLQLLNRHAQRHFQFFFAMASRPDLIPEEAGGGNGAGGGGGAPGAPPVQLAMTQAAGGSQAVQGATEQGLTP
jgi:hypothetical protein